MNNNIEYVVADVREHPELYPEETIIIPHCCNDINAMGAGVARALYEKWPEVKSIYHDQKSEQKLGRIIPVKVDVNPSKYVVNMIGQHGCGLDEDGNPPVRYLALGVAMQRTLVWIRDMEFQSPVIYTVKFGAALAGGRWDFIEELIKEIWLPHVPVTVCVIDESELP